MAPIRVLIVDDSRFARSVIWHAFVNATGFEVVGTACDGLEALEAIMRLSPDVVTLDWNMPICDGPQVLEKLRTQAAPDKRPKVVVVTANEIPANDIVAQGACEVVRKAGDTMSLDELIDAVRRASARAS